MRNIEFRGKDIETGEWVYGSYFEHKKVNLCIASESEIIENIQHLIIKDKVACDWNFENGIQCIDVDHKTVGQFTGLEDKNGKKIYEGDIILSQKMSDKPFSKKAKSKRLIGYVIYDIEEGFGFYNEDTKEWNAHKQYGAKYTVVFGKEQYKYRCIPWGEFYNCEVIGNIYDNPEMVEGL